MNNILEATLQIKDNNIIWDDRVQEKIFKKRKSLFYSATYTHKPEFCAVCGCVSQNNNIVKNGTKTSRITLCSVSGLPAYLNLRKQRFLCRECGSSFTADTNRIVEKHCHISKWLKNEIKNKWNSIWNIYRKRNKCFSSYCKTYHRWYSTFPND